MGTTGRANVLRFWRAVEFFDPQRVPEPRWDSKGRIVDVEPHEALPWHPDHPLRKLPLPADREWCYTVYVGLYRADRVVAELERVLGAESPYASRAKEQYSAVVGFVVDGDGVVDPDSAVLSACAWASGRLNRPGPSDPAWLEGLETEQDALRRALAGLRLHRPPGPPVGDTEVEGGGVDEAGGGLAPAVGRRLVDATTDAIGAGVKSTGTAVTRVTAAAVGAVAGPLVGGVVGAVAGTFVEKVLTLRETETAEDGATPPSPPDPSRTAARPGAIANYMTAQYLNEFLEDLAETLGIDTTLAPAGVRVDCWSRRRRNDSSDQQVQPPMLNSMLIDDLGRVARSVREGEAGRTLLDYLTEDDNVNRSSRIDVRRERGAVLDAVRPERKPAGRWPSKSAQPLVTAQQFAVNTIRESLSTRDGIFAVNGPPGTGKTTLLRDLIAALVVDRADVLSNYANPDDAFSGTERYDDGERKRWINVLRPEVTGFEMVVATNGNDAAENITHEIPGAGAAAAEFDARRQCDYFPELADDLLEKESWGLIAAALGRRKNNQKFRGRLEVSRS